MKCASYFLRESLHSADTDLINSETVLQAIVRVTSPFDIYSGKEGIGHHSKLHNVNYY